MEELENLENKSTWGGARQNSGRPEGVKNKATLEKKIVEEEMKQRVLRNSQRLLDAQLSLAQGCSYLYKTEKDSKGKNKKPELVVDPETIADYLDGEFGDGENISDSAAYYYITASAPDNKAIDSLFDRALGKARQNIGLDGGEDGKPVGVVILPQKNGNSLGADNKTTGGISQE